MMKTSAILQLIADLWIRDQYNSICHQSYLSSRWIRHPSWSMHQPYCRGVVIMA